MAKRQSRLQETDYSQFNLRDAYITDMAEYLANLRDSAIFDNWGIKVLIKIPVDDIGNLNENNVDCYSNFVDTTWLDTTEIVIPKFNDYRQNISEEGMSADGVDAIYPLEVLIPSKLHLPRNSRIIFSEYNSREEKIAREWVVLGTQMKQLSNSKTYTRIANCVPARQSLFTAANTSDGNIWFDYYLQNTYKDLRLKAQGNIWFLRNKIYSNKIQKAYSNIIREDVSNDFEYTEDSLIEMYYDNRSKNIINCKNIFEVGDKFKIKTIDNKPIYILIDKEHNIKIELELIVTKISETGEISSYIFNTTSGYTKFTLDLIGYIFNDKQNRQLASIKLNSFALKDDIYEEDITGSDLINTKYLSNTNAEFIITAKNVSVSVLI